MDFYKIIFCGNKVAPDVNHKVNRRSFGGRGGIFAVIIIPSIGEGMTAYNERLKPLTIQAKSKSNYKL